MYDWLIELKFFDMYVSKSNTLQKEEAAMLKCA